MDLRISFALRAIAAALLFMVFLPACSNESSTGAIAQKASSEHKASDALESKASAASDLPQDDEPSVFESEESLEIEEGLQPESSESADAADDNPFDKEFESRHSDAYAARTLPNASVHLALTA